jgi:alkylhydroperoxidase/carboxymuconolactone decarboxylase family protein YurZ
MQSTIHRQTFGRTGLDLKSREIATVAALVTMGNADK